MLGKGTFKTGSLRLATTLLLFCGIFSVEVHGRRTSGVKFG